MVRYSLLEKASLQKLVVFGFVVMLAFSTSARAHAQKPFSPRSLVVEIFADGVASIEYVLDVDVTYASIEVLLFGGSFENLLVLNHLGELLDYVPIEGGVRIYTLGTYRARITYETTDLTSEVGGIWTFSMDSPVNAEIVLPRDADIISLSQPPISIESVEGRTVLTMPAGDLEVVYTIIVPAEELKIYRPVCLTFQLFADGVVHVNYVIEADITHLTVQISLFGRVFRNVVITNQHGEPLDYNVINGYLIIHTLGAYLVNIEFDTADLTREQAGVWTFTVQVPIESVVVLPARAEIVSVNIPPLSVDEVDGRPELVMPKGDVEIVYMIVVKPTPTPAPTPSPTVSPTPPTPTPAPTPAPTLPEEQFPTELILVAIVAVALVVVVAILLKRRKG